MRRYALLGHFRSLATATIATYPNDDEIHAITRINASNYKIWCLFRSEVRTCMSTEIVVGFLTSKPCSGKLLPALGPAGPSISMEPSLMYRRSTTYSTVNAIFVFAVRGLSHNAVEVNLAFFLSTQERIPVVLFFFWRRLERHGVYIRHPYSLLVTGH